jgi:hypothetical protein
MVLSRINVTQPPPIPRSSGCKSALIFLRPARVLSSASVRPANRAPLAQKISDRTHVRCYDGFPRLRGERSGRGQSVRQSVRQSAFRFPCSLISRISRFIRIRCYDRKGRRSEVLLLSDLGFRTYFGFRISVFGFRFSDFPLTLTALAVSLAIAASIVPALPREYPRGGAD